MEFAAVTLSGGPTAATAGRLTLTARHGAVSSCHVSAAPGAAAPRLLLIGDDDTVTMAQIGGQSIGDDTVTMAQIGGQSIEDDTVTMAEIGGQSIGDDTVTMGSEVSQ